MGRIKGSTHRWPRGATIMWPNGDITCMEESTGPGRFSTTLPSGVKRILWIEDGRLAFDDGDVFERPPGFNRPRSNSQGSAGSRGSDSKDELGSRTQMQGEWYKGDQCLVIKGGTHRWPRGATILWPDSNRTSLDVTGPGSFSTNI